MWSGSRNEALAVGQIRTTFKLIRPTVSFSTKNIRCCIFFILLHCIYKRCHPLNYDDNYSVQQESVPSWDTFKSSLTYRITYSVPTLQKLSNVWALVSYPSLWIMFIRPTFRVRRSRSEMYIDHGRLCVCLSVCVSVPRCIPTTTWTRM